MGVARADAPEAAAPVDPEVKHYLEDAQRAVNGGNFDLAAIQLKSALRVKSDPEVRGTLGVVLFRLGNMADSERELRQACPMAPDIRNICLSCSTPCSRFRNFINC